MAPNTASYLDLLRFNLVPLWQEIDSVRSREDLARFVSSLASDARTSLDAWETSQSKGIGGVERVDYRHAGVFPKSTPRDAHCAQLVTNCRYVIRGQNLRIDRGTTREAHGGSWQAERLRGTDLLRMHTNPGEAQQRDVSGQ